MRTAHARLVLLCGIAAVASTFVPVSFDDGCTCGPETIVFAEAGLFVPALTVTLIALLRCAQPTPWVLVPVNAIASILAVLVGLLGMFGAPWITLSHLVLAIMVFSTWLARRARPDRRRAEPPSARSIARRASLLGAAALVVAASTLLRVDHTTLAGLGLHVPPLALAVIALVRLVLVRTPSSTIPRAIVGRRIHSPGALRRRAAESTTVSCLLHAAAAYAALAGVLQGFGSTSAITTHAPLEAYVAAHAALLVLVLALGRHENPSAPRPQ